MKKLFSLLACLLISFVLFNQRITRSDIRSEHPLLITTWDAFGYYIYLPSFFIYKDVKKLAWAPEMDKKYALSGGDFYQAHIHKKTGNYVFKYLGGVSIMQIPFFLAGHWYARHSAYEADGFSPPYQYALGFGVILYVILALFLLRHILLRYYDDTVTAITLLLLFLASNIIQYVSVDGAMSHAWIFPLYVFLLYTTIRWHEEPRWYWAGLAGLIMGLATISRPTEAIMFFIPLFWNTQNKEAASEKWKLVRTHRAHIYAAVAAGIIGILPQLLYWKYVTGSFIYDVGSAWDFLTPHLRVLIGFEKGWFIYTPITLFFMAGLFFIRKFPFRKAVLIFCLVNIYIIISWRDWRYGGSYSTRALVQSYPVFALAFAGFIDYLQKTKWKYLFYVLGTYLILVNFIQLKQYFNTVLHYYDMNRRYYARIYLKQQPSALDFSLMDTREWIRSEKRFEVQTIYEADRSIQANSTPDAPAEIADMDLVACLENPDVHSSWLKIEANILTGSGLFKGYLNSVVYLNDSVKHTKIRLFRPLTSAGSAQDYAMYVKVPEYFREGRFRICLDSDQALQAEIKELKVSCLTR